LRNWVKITILLSDFNFSIPFLSFYTDQAAYLSSCMMTFAVPFYGMMRYYFFEKIEKKFAGNKKAVTFALAKKQ